MSLPTNWDNTLTKPKLERPNMYAVVVKNDDFTPMAFVVAMFQEVFDFDYNRATQLMLVVHQEGQAKVGSFTYDVADTKATRIVNTARHHEYPLLAFAEPV